MTVNQRPTLLLLDDEERVVRSLRMLFRNDYRTIPCTSGDQALAALQKEKVQVIISDQRMPGMTGVQFLKQARQVSPNTMRILLTGYSDFEAVIDSVNEGEVFRFVNKPWNPEKLRATVAKAAKIAAESEAVVEEESQPPLSSAKPLDLLLLDTEARTFASVTAAAGSTFNVHWARNLQDALSVLSSHEISILVSELKLDGEDISSAIKILKEYNPGLMAIIVTSFSDVTSLIDLINQGQVYRYLPKPVSDGLLQRTITTTVNRYQQLQLKPKLLERYAVEKITHPNELRIASRLRYCIDRFRKKHAEVANARPL